MPSSKPFSRMRAERIVVDTNVLIIAALWLVANGGGGVDTIRKASGVLLFSSEAFQVAQPPARLAFDGCAPL